MSRRFHNRGQLDLGDSTNPEYCPLHYRVVDMDGIKLMKGAMEEAMIDNFNLYKVRIFHSTSDISLEVPQLKDRLLSLEGRIGSMFEKMSVLMDELKSEQTAVEELVEDAQIAITSQETWWENVDVLYPDATIIWEELKKQNPPRDAAALASHIGDVMDIGLSYPECREPWDEEQFFKRFDNEVEQISFMKPGGYKASFDLQLDIKLNRLQRPDQTTWHPHQARFLERHVIINKSFAKMLSNYGDDPTDEMLHYINAAQACPKVRARMSEVPCRATHLGQSCLYNSLVTTLDILQRRAYEEIRLKVVRAVDDRLPPELTVLIFEYTMAAEEVPFDPRVYVNARNKETGEIKRKSRMICPHPKAVLEPRTEVRRANRKRPTLAYSDEWEEIKGFNHLDVFKRRAENDTYRYDKFFGISTRLMVSRGLAKRDELRNRLGNEFSR